MSVSYYRPLYHGPGERQSLHSYHGWYFVIPACDAPPEVEGDTIAGMFPCKEMAQAAIRLCTQTIVHCNDNVARLT